MNCIMAKLSSLGPVSPYKYILYAKVWWYFLCSCVVKQGVQSFQLFTVPFSLALSAQNLYENNIFKGRKIKYGIGWIWQQTKVNPISQLDLLNETVSSLTLAIIFLSVGDSTFYAENIWMLAACVKCDRAWTGH